MYSHQSGIHIASVYCTYYRWRCGSLTVRHPESPSGSSDLTSHDQTLCWRKGRRLPTGPACKLIQLVIPTTYVSIMFLREGHCKLLRLVLAQCIVPIGMHIGTCTPSTDGVVVLPLTCRTWNPRQGLELTSHDWKLCWHKVVGITIWTNLGKLIQLIILTLCQHNVDPWGT
jgi:hypothetical protein